MSQFIKFYFTSSMLNMFQTAPQPTTPKLEHTSKQEHTTNMVIQ